MGVKWGKWNGGSREVEIREGEGGWGGNDE